MHLILFFLSISAFLPAPSVSTSRTFTTNKNLFLDVTLHFILTGNGTHVLNFPPFFYTMLSYNLETPVILEYYKSWDFSGTKYSLETYINSNILIKPLSITKHSTSNLVTFIDLYRYWGSSFQARLQNRFNALTHLLLGISKTGLNPAYIFLHASIAELLEIQNPYLIYPAIGLTSKFVVLDGPSLYIVCIPCYSQPIRLQGHYSLSKFDKIYTTLHKNLHQQPVLLGQGEPIPGHPCLPSGFRFFQKHTNCATSVMEKLLNFTSVYPPKPTGSVYGYIILEGIRPQDFQLFSRSVDRYQLISYGEEINYYDFAIVTNKHTTVGGLEAMISPYDMVTWISITSSCTGIMVMFQLQPEYLDRTS